MGLRHHRCLNLLAWAVCCLWSVSLHCRSCVELYCQCQLPNQSISLFASKYTYLNIIYVNGRSPKTQSSTSWRPIINETKGNIVLEKHTIQYNRPFFLRVEALVVFILDAADDEQLSLTWTVSRQRWMPAAVDIKIKYKYKKSHTSYWHYGGLQHQRCLNLLAWAVCCVCSLASLSKLRLTRLPVLVTQALLLASRGSGGLHSWCW